MPLLPHRRSGIGGRLARRMQYVRLTGAVLNEWKASADWGGEDIKP